MDRDETYLERKKEIKRYILKYQESGKSPTFREIQKGAGIPSLATVSDVVKELAKEGVIELDGRSSNVRIAPPKPVTLTPDGLTKTYLVGEVPCGEPFDIESFSSDNPDDEPVYLPNDFFGDDEYYIVRAKGRSMINRGIYPDDLLVVHPYMQIYSGLTVFASVRGSGDDCGNTCKIYTVEKSRALLRPANDERRADGTRMYEDIDLSQYEDTRILGVVEQVIHYPNRRDNRT